MIEVSLYVHDAETGALLDWREIAIRHRDETADLFLGRFAGDNGSEFFATLGGNDLISTFEKAGALVQITEDPLAEALARAA
jgi:hypothetical protein